MRVRVLVIIGLAVLVLGAIATARLTDLPDTPVWAVVATAGLGLLTTLVTDVLSARMQSINERRRDLARQCIGGEAGQLPRVAEVTDLLPLGVRATRLTEAGSDQLTMPGYIQRDADVELDRLIGHGGLIIAAGPSSSGRTRSLFEAVRRVYPDRLLVAPIDVTSLTAMLAIGIPYRRCVVWLGRLDRYTADNGLGVYSLIQSARRGRRPGVVVATWDPSSEAVVDGNDLLSETLRSARTVHYSIDWTAAELARARQDAKTGSALAVALERMGNGTQLVVALLGTEPSSAPNPYLLPPSPRCLGRDVQIAEVAASLANASAVCVLGAPGIGKATVLRAALHDAGVSKMYGPRRIFVQCEGSTSAQNVIAEIALALRLPLGNDLLGRLLTELATRPTAVVLSGIGDPWERDTVRIEDLLSRLAGVPGVGLAVSVRGAAAPLGVSWAHQIRLRRLDHQTAREVFLAVAGEGFRSDPYLNDLVAAQDGVPLAIELLAFSAQAEPDLSSLWRRWSTSRGGGPRSVDPDYDRFDTSVALSIESVRMNDSSLRLLSVLASLPDGIDSRDLDQLMPGTGEVAAATLRRVGLAYDEQGRLRMLKPIRDYVRRTRPLPSTIQDNVAGHYTNMAKVLSKGVGGTNGQMSAARLLAEGANIERAIRHGLKGPDPADAGEATCALATSTRYTGLGGQELLLEAGQAAARVGNAHLEAVCTYHLADLDMRQSRLDSALERFRYAQTLLQRVGDIRYLADTVKHIGDVLFEQCDFQSAGEHFNEAVALYRQLDDRRGVANCVKCQGEVAERQSDYDRATSMYQEARSAFQDLGDDLGIADIDRRAADISIARKDADTAADLYAIAARAYESMGAVLGLANCVLGQAWVALLRDDADAAIEFVLRAEPYFDRMSYVRGQAKCLGTLALIAEARGDLDAAQEHLRAAEELFTQVGDIIGEADCLLGLARTKADATALSDAREALSRYEQTGRVIGIARSHELLAKLTDDDAERAAAAGQAIAAYRHIGFSADATRVANDFPDG